MENISPTLRLALKISEVMDSGQSVKMGILDFLKTDFSDFSETVRAWLFQIEQNFSSQLVLNSTNPYQRVLLICLENGLKGAPIKNQLLEIQNEIQKNCELEIEELAASLPVKLLFPLLFLMFPAFMILILGPFISDLLGSVL
jgi:hypothetical protein